MIFSVKSEKHHFCRCFYRQLINIKNNIGLINYGRTDFIHHQYYLVFYSYFQSSETTNDESIANPIESNRLMQDDTPHVEDVSIEVPNPSEIVETSQNEPSELDKLIHEVSQGNLVSFRSFSHFR